MLPSPYNSSSTPRTQVSFALIKRHVLARRRWWYLCLVFIAALSLLTTSYTPRRFRFRVFKSSRPQGGPRPRPVRPAKGDLWAGRANEVRKAFVHAYTGYQHHALPFDELRPISGERINNFHGWGVTMYDSLDTMWLMGLEDMFYDTVEDVAGANFGMEMGEHAHFFEVVIRYLGGLLSAYALSEDPRLLKLADDLGGKLLPAFNTASGFPLRGVNTETGTTPHGPSDRDVCLAEVLSNQMEFKYLAHITGKSEYYTATERPMKAMYGEENTMLGGLLATVWDVTTGKPNMSHMEFSASGCADSAYEYLLKQWLMTGQKEPKMRDLYIRSANAILEQLLYIGSHRDLLYVTELKRAKPTNRFEHLACFLPALLALGVETPALGLTAGERERHSWAAEGLAQTCWAVYNDTATGLSPDDLIFDMWTVTERGRWATHLREWESAGRPGPPPGTSELERQPTPQGRGYTPMKDSYLLRPEAVETFYLMWRTTGDVKWRERGWAVFQSLQTYSRVRYGYTSIRYVDERTPYKFDDMPSWFLAETLKYLFLLFTDEELVPLDKWVFNTEAHPFPVFEWSEREIEEYEIVIE